MARPKQKDLPGVEGEGVSPITDKKLTALGDEFIEVRDAKAKQAEELGEIEAKILDRMNDLQITRYRFGDQEAVVKPGKNHVKIKTVKAESNGDADADE